MRITQWGELGILFSIFIAERQLAGSKSVSATEIAESQGIDLQYAHQILQRLRNGGILSSSRGPRGGYFLSRPAEEIDLRQILECADGSTLEIICEVKPIDHERCNPAQPCSLRPIWRALKDHINQFLSSKRLSDLVGSAELLQISKADDPIKIGSSRA